MARGVRYTAEQFITALEGTGGIIAEVARRVGCDWHTARKFIDTHPTVHRAWQDERRQVSDRAQNNIIAAIEDGDLQISKWWLQVMDQEFEEHQAVTLRLDVRYVNPLPEEAGDGGAAPDASS